MMDTEVPNATCYIKLFIIEHPKARTEEQACTIIQTSIPQVPKYKIDGSIRQRSHLTICNPAKLVYR